MWCARRPFSPSAAAGRSGQHSLSSITRTVSVSISTVGPCTFLGFRWARMDEKRLSGPARRLVAMLAEYPDGLSLAQLGEYARARFRGLPAARVAALAREAIAAGAITDDRGR